MMHNKVELLAPAGDLEKLKMAILYGADAVYLAGKNFGMRTASDNFSIEELTCGVDFAHARGKKVYLTMNIIPHNDLIIKVADFIRASAKTGIDAVIVSDPGIFEIIRETVPDLPIHISTQANNTNYQSVHFWQRQGAKRIVLARELSLTEIREISDHIGDQIELEVFVHGAMCISYSGRCLLSSYMIGRDANQGDCAQPCRWRYHLVEEKRPGQYYPIEENESGTFVFNSKDLCMIEHIPELIQSGIKSMKIEGRVKSAFYVASVVKAYRDAIDAYYEEGHGSSGEWLSEVSKVSNRDFTTGFFFGKPSSLAHHYGSSSYIRTYDFIGVVKGYDTENKRLIVEQRNNFKVGDTIEILPPYGKFIEMTIYELFDSLGNKIETAPHAQMEVFISNSVEVPVSSMIRRKSND